MSHQKVNLFDKVHKNILLDMFSIAFAQENWLRGYQQALYDVDYGELSKNEQESTRVSE